MPRHDRAQLAESLRELAVLIECDPDRPVPFSIDAVRHLAADEQDVLDVVVASLGGGEVMLGRDRDDGETPIDRYVIRLDGNITYGVQWCRGELRVPHEVSA